MNHWRLVCGGPGFGSATLAYRTTAPWAANNLTRSLRLCWCYIRLLTFCSFSLRFFAFRCRLLHFDLFAGVIVADFLTGPAGNLCAAFSVRLETVVANQRANATVLLLTASSASTLATLTSSFTPACLLNRSSERCEAAFQLPSIRRCCSRPGAIRIAVNGEDRPPSAGRIFRPVASTPRSFLPWLSVRRAFLPWPSVRQQLRLFGSVGCFGRLEAFGLLFGGLG